LVVYFAVVAAVGLISPRVVRPLHQEQCSDDWCIAVDSVRRDSSSEHTTYDVTLKLWSRARRALQRERFVVSYIVTGAGQRIDPEPDPAAVPFDTLLQPGETVRATRRFVVPPTAGAAALVISREGGFRFPGCCIIGDENSFFHKHAVTTLHTPGS
jgi:hypothetical protein